MFLHNSAWQFYVYKQDIHIYYMTGREYRRE